MFSKIYHILETNYPQSNNIEVLLDINVSDVVVTVPQSLLGFEAREDSAQPGVYGVGACVLATIPEIQLAFRLSDDFMGESLESLYGRGVKRSHPTSSEMNLNIYSVGLQILPKCPNHELWERGKGRRRRRNKDAITVQGDWYDHRVLFLPAELLFRGRHHGSSFIWTSSKTYDVCLHLGNRRWRRQGLYHAPRSSGHFFGSVIFPSQLQR